MSMREKAKLRKYGWAGDCTREEVRYIRDWLQSCIDRWGYNHIYVTLAEARRHAMGE